MRNRAKCAECKDIIESLAVADVVTCTCGNCTIWGGTQELRTKATDYSKFLRVDDDGKELPVIWIEQGEDGHSEIKSHCDLDKDKGRVGFSLPSTPIDELIAFKEYLDKWPAGRLHSPCTYADLRDLASLVLSALQSPPL